MYPADLLSVLLAITLYASLTSATFFLSQFQGAVGFSQPCEDAYNAPITGCDVFNFPNNCSDGCFVALEQASALINNACAPQEASFDSILGQFFACNGPQFMCTGILANRCSTTSGSMSSSTGLSSSFSSSTTVGSTSTSSTSETTTTESSSKSKSTHSTFSTKSQPSTVSGLTSTSSTFSSTSTPSTSSSNPPAGKVFITTAFNNGVATVLTSQAERTSAAKSNPDAFGGGGSPFEIGPNGSGAENQARAGADFWLLMSVIFGVLVMR